MRTIDRYRTQFESFLPRIEAHASVALREVRCRHKREELTAEMVGLCWAWFLRLKKRGKEPTEFVSALATYAAKAVRSGRRVCGQEKARDALSPFAQARHSFTVSSIPLFSTLNTNPFAEALADNLVTPVDEQVAFRFDFAAFYRSYSSRDRDIMEAMVEGDRTMELADKFGLTAGRISQKRREYMECWNRFIGEA